MKNVTVGLQKTVRKTLVAEVTANSEPEKLVTTEMTLVVKTAFSKRMEHFVEPRVDSVTWKKNATEKVQTAQRIPSRLMEQLVQSIQQPLSVPLDNAQVETCNAKDEVFSNLLERVPLLLQNVSCTVKTSQVSVYNSMVFSWMEHHVVKLGNVKKVFVQVTILVSLFFSQGKGVL
jgi:hypothetical protein